jgi:hypothetical protein
VGSNVYMFLLALTKKRKEYLNEGGESCVVRRSTICAVSRYYQGDKVEDDEMGGL